MKIYLDDSKCREQLIPFSLTRNVADFRIGIFTIKEKWKLILNNEFDLIGKIDNHNDCIVIPSNIIPTNQNYQLIIEACQNQSVITETEEIKFINQPWHIFQCNDWAIRKDFEIIREKKSDDLSNTNTIIGDSNNIFVEKGAIVEHCILNANFGPIYIAKDALIMEGSMIRGPFSILNNSVVKMGSKIYGATSIGPNCIVGGEIKNSVFFENSNKAHDGYLGDSVIGAWCNIGAGTSCSNVKNTGGLVKYQLSKFSEPVEAVSKGGLLMADYSRCAINTSFNTGTVVGVCCNIFGNENPKKYLDHFSWGNERYIYEKAVKDIDNWKKMKKMSITENEIDLLKQLFIKQNN